MYLILFLQIEGQFSVFLFLPASSLIVVQLQVLLRLFAICSVYSYIISVCMIVYAMCASVPHHCIEGIYFVVPF